jgi:hypothetical protein
MPLATTASGGDDFLTSTSTHRTESGAIIRNFLHKCGLITTSSSILSNTMVTIEQKIAKLSLIPKDKHEFTSFGQVNGREMPKLAVIARKYLCVCGTNVPSELAFSVSNYVLRKNRLALSSKNVIYTMFLKDKVEFFLMIEHQKLLEIRMVFHC